MIKKVAPAIFITTSLFAAESKEVVPALMPDALYTRQAKALLTKVLPQSRKAFKDYLQDRTAKTPAAMQQLVAGDCHYSESYQYDATFLHSNRNTPRGYSKGHEYKIYLAQEAERLEAAQERKKLGCRDHEYLYQEEQAYIDRLPKISKREFLHRRNKEFDKDPLRNSYSYTRMEQGLRLAQEILKLPELQAIV